MKKIFRTIIMLFIASLFLGGSCWGQPRSDYPVTWGVVTGAATYEVFVWEGADTTTCPFIYGQDYLSPDVSSFFSKSTTLVGTTIDLANNGEYVIVGVLARNSALIYGGMGKSVAYLKQEVPGIPSAINVVLP